MAGSGSVKRHRWRRSFTGFKDDVNDDDYINEELPVVLASFGPSVLPALAGALANKTRDERSRLSLTDALSQLVKYYPDARESCVALIVSQLQTYDPQDAALNGFLIGNLIDFKATEAASVVQMAYQRGAVDETVCGIEEDALVDLGAMDPTPGYLERKQRQEQLFQTVMTQMHESTPSARLKPVTTERAKAKRKQQKLARKKNRRR